MFELISEDDEEEGEEVLISFLTEISFDGLSLHIELTFD